MKGALTLLVNLTLNRTKLESIKAKECPPPQQNTYHQTAAALLLLSPPPSQRALLTLRQIAVISAVVVDGPETSGGSGGGRMGRGDLKNKRTWTRAQEENTMNHKEASCAQAHMRGGKNLNNKTQTHKAGSKLGWTCWRKCECACACHPVSTLVSTAVCFVRLLCSYCFTGWYF